MTRPWLVSILAAVAMASAVNFYCNSLTTDTLRQSSAQGATILKPVATKAAALVPAEKQGFSSPVGQSITAGDFSIVARKIKRTRTAHSYLSTKAYKRHVLQTAWEHGYRGHDLNIIAEMVDYAQRYWAKKGVAL